MKWLIMDVHFLCWRAFHTMGELSHDDIKTGVIYGFLRDVVRLKEDFSCGSVVFCFDSPYSRRQEVFPAYKEKRHNRPLTEQEQQARQEMWRQINKLREHYLPRMGFANVFLQDGYESDDLIASIALGLGRGDDAVVITADHDLLQVLRGNVMLHDPTRHKTVTLQSFKRDRGLEPRQWARVQALSGCKTDEVPGIPGVGEKTAIKFLLGVLKEESKPYRHITSEKGKQWRARNLQLVQLPYPGTMTCRLTPDEVDKDGWEGVMKELGMRTLSGRAPVALRPRRGFGL